MCEEQLKKAKQMYIEGALTLKETASASGIRAGLVRDHSATEGWVRERNAWRAARGLARLKQTGPKNINWARMKTEYVMGKKRVAKLATEYGVSEAMVYRKIRNEGWRLKTAEETANDAKKATAENTEGEARTVSDEIGTRYITGCESLAKLARKYQCSYGRLKGLAEREYWGKQREAYRKRQAAITEAISMNSAEQFAQRIADDNATVLDMADEMLNRENLKPRDLLLLSEVLLNLAETVQRRQTGSSYGKYETESLRETGKVIEIRWDE